jgi:ferrochelatase
VADAAPAPVGAGAPVGVLVMAYGTPARAEDLEAYYTDIRRGRPPPAELLDDLRRRYDAIGGLSPLGARSRAQAAGLQAALDARAPGRFRVELGYKHASPSIEEAAGALLRSGAALTVALVLAPHYSALSVGQYLERGEAATAGAELRPVRSWHLEPGLVDLLAQRVVDALRRFPDEQRVEVLVTAHSLPERVLAMDDPYPDQLRETAEAVAAAAGVARWRLAWQSAGRTPEPWLGPDLLEVIRDLPAAGADGVVVCPAGFVADHLEVLYDVDIEARAVAASIGLRLERTASLNDDPRFLEVLADVVIRHADAGP